MANNNMLSPINRIPLVDEKADLEELLTEESIVDPVYLSKINKILKFYTSIRQIRPDGNSFFRAYCFSIFEKLIQRPELRPAFQQKLINARKLLADAGLATSTVLKCYEKFQKTVQKVIGGMTEKALQLQLQTDDHGKTFDNFVIFLRNLASAELRKNAKFYQNFAQAGRTIEELCQLEVEQMSMESDHIHILALNSALSFGVRVVYMDCGPAKYDFPQGSEPTFHLLYRTGHYDILYTS